MIAAIAYSPYSGLPASPHPTSKMRHAKVLLLVAVCLCSGGVHAQTAATTTAAATALPTEEALTAAVHAGLAGVLPGIPTQGGVAATLKVMTPAGRLPLVSLGCRC